MLPPFNTASVLNPFLTISLLVLISGCHRVANLDEANFDEATQKLPIGEIESPTWDLILLQGEPIGFARTCVGRESTSRGPVVKWEQVTSINVKRFGESMQQTISATSRELLDGGLVDGSWTIVGSGNQQGGTVAVASNGEGITITPNDEGRSIKRPWQSEQGGFFAVEQSLRSHPIEPGQSRDVVGLLPLLNQIAKFTLTAKTVESVELLNRSQELLRIENEIALADATKMHVTLWVDTRGVVHKQTFRELNQTMIRTDEQTARSAAAGSMDLGKLATVRLLHQLDTPPNLHQSESATFRIRRKQKTIENTTSPFAHDDFQKVTTNIDGSLSIVVTRTHSATNHTTVNEAIRSAALQSSQLIDHEQPLIRSLLKQAIEQPQTTNSETAAEISNKNSSTAYRLEKFVHAYIERKDYSQLLLGASEVAQQKRGDCTEHAVLLAALCRAAGIPSRIAIGIVHVPAEDGFVFHMWNESLLANHWTPLDATLGQGGIGAGHIKVRTTCLSEEAGLNDFLPIAQLAGQIEIELEEFAAR